MCCQRLAFFAARLVQSCVSRVRSLGWLTTSQLTNSALLTDMSLKQLRKGAFRPIEEMGLTQNGDLLNAPSWPILLQKINLKRVLRALFSPSAFFVLQSTKKHSITGSAHRVDRWQKTEWSDVTTGSITSAKMSSGLQRKTSSATIVWYKNCAGHLLFGITCWPNTALDNFCHVNTCTECAKSVYCNWLKIKIEIGAW